MKQFMLEMMAAMMPFMMPLVWAGAALLGIGLLAALLGLLRANSGVGAMHGAGALLVALGIFFLACQAAGMLLGATPAINFGDAKKFEFHLVGFWVVGLAFLLPGLVFARLRRG
jgi:hypothetical protein